MCQFDRAEYDKVRVRLMELNEDLGEQGMFSISLYKEMLAAHRQLPRASNEKSPR